MIERKEANWAPSRQQSWRWLQRRTFRILQPRRNTYTRPTAFLEAYAKIATSQSLLRHAIRNEGVSLPCHWHYLPRLLPRMYTLEKSLTGHFLISPRARSLLHWLFGIIMRRGSLRIFRCWIWFTLHVIIYLPRAYILSCHLPHIAFSIIHRYFISLIYLLLISIPR